mmetsp:Transcript_2143/g.8427  ORF Transcript_2143/g.8427 Transcript_2143/m.8427 type:complete len:629 (+) Transcript_2143:790-2676(+)
MILERLTGEDLFDRLSKAEGGLSEDEVRSHAKIMLEALILLQQLGCAHRNIKPEVFKFSRPDELGELRMSDFSFGYQSDNPNKLIKQLCGTPPYLPPEICRNQFYKPVLADMWSFGASLYVLFSGTFPFGSGDKLDPLFNRIQNAQPSFSGSKWKSISEPAKDLICKLLKKEPEERLSAAEAVDSPFIRYATLRQRFRYAQIKVIAMNRLMQFLVEDAEPTGLADTNEVPSLPKEVLSPKALPAKTETTITEGAAKSRFSKAAGALFTEGSVHERWDVDEKVLGKGAFGEVVTGRAKDNPEVQVAIKNMRLRGVPEEQLALFEGECASLRLLCDMDKSHRLLHAYEVSEHNNTLSIVLELCRGGPLFDRIVKKGTYSEMDAARDLRKMLEDIKFLHSIGIAHRDIKPENFMFTKEGVSQLKLIDFGFAIYSDDPEHMVNDFLGTIQYLPPEIVRRQWYQPKKADIWSLGVVVYVMFSGRFPFGNAMGKNVEMLFQRIVRKEPDFRGGAWVHVSESCKDLVRWMLNKNPRLRPTAEEALKHPWLRSTELSTQSLKASVDELQAFQIRSKFRVALFRMVALRNIGGAIYDVSQQRSSEESSKSTEPKSEGSATEKPADQDVNKPASEETV